MKYPNEILWKFYGNFMEILWKFTFNYEFGNELDKMVTCYGLSINESTNLESIGTIKHINNLKISKYKSKSKIYENL